MILRDTLVPKDIIAFSDQNIRVDPYLHASREREKAMLDAWLEVVTPDTPLPLTPEKRHEWWLAFRQRWSFRNELLSAGIHPDYHQKATSRLSQLGLRGEMWHEGLTRARVKRRKRRTDPTYCILCWTRMIRDDVQYHLWNCPGRLKESSLDSSPGSATPHTDKSSQ